MQALFEAVRHACGANAWSRGVEFTRANAVVRERADDEEVVLKVVTHEKMVSPTVTLWPEDEDWSCDCGSREEACAHVAAAVITLRRAGQEGKALPTAQAAGGRLRYCFTRMQGALGLERVIVQEGKTQRLTSPLTARQGAGAAVIATQADLAIEVALGPNRQGRLPRDIMPRLLKALQQCPDVRLDDQPIQISTTPIGLCACVEDRGEGFRLFVELEPEITETFTNGIVLCGNTLRALRDSGLTAREMEELPDGRFFPESAVAELITDILPALEKRLPVDVRTSRLPKLTIMPPRLVLDVHRDGEALTVLPTLVYGQPPLARIDAGRLVHLGGAVPQRDTLAEQRLSRQLKQALDLSPGRKAHFTGAQAVRFATRLRSWSGDIQGQGHKAFAQAPALAARWRLETGNFDVWFESGDASQAGRPVAKRANAAAVLRAWRQGETFLALADGGWAPLPLAWLEQFGEQVADLLAARQANGNLSRYALPDLARLCDDLEQPRPPEFASLGALLEDFHGIPSIPLPGDVRATLRPYQQLGVNWLAFLRQSGLGAMLADDMGLGKTLQALCVIQGRTLVVAPTSVLHHWADEIQRFRPALRLKIYHGPQRQLDADAEVTLTTYALLRLDADQLAVPSWDTVVLDEAQNIKNPESQVTRAAYRLRAAFRLTLSGTPVENRLDELWSQFHFLNRGLLGGRQDFQERYAHPIVTGRPGAAAHLRERIRPFLLRRRKQEVAPELPPRTDMVLRCELSPSERAVYDAIRAATLADVVARLEQGGNVLAALEALLRLRQASCHTGLVPGQTAATSSKVILLLDALGEAVAEGHKALVFSQWTALLDRVEPHLRQADIAFTRLDGTTRDRARVVRDFQDDAGPPVMLISLRAGGTGLNLTAADHVFLLDPWWNPAVEDQAADRTHRIGQTRPVLVHRLVAEDTVEERILALQQHKRALAEAALEGTEGATAITREELLALLA